MTPVSDVPRFAPKWPDDLPTDRFRFVYDRPADTLFVHFYGEAPPASSEPVDVGDRDYIFLRVDPLTDEAVGLQIETFLAYAVGQNPSYVASLEVAEMRGMNDPDAANLRRWARDRAQGMAGAYDLIGEVERLGA